MSGNASGVDESLSGWRRKPIFDFWSSNGGIICNHIYFDFYFLLLKEVLKFIYIPQILINIYHLLLLALS